MNTPLHPLLAEQLASLDISQEKITELLPLLKKISTAYGEKEETEAALEKTNKELDRFVYSVSHDLRAPIASILGLLNLAEPEDNMEAIQQYLGLMRNSTTKMDRFIYNLISYSQTNRLENTPEPIDFKSFVGEIASSLRYLPNAFHIDFIQEYPESLLFRSDKPKLKIILTNLLTNSIQYHNLKQDKPFIRLTVSGNEKEAIIGVQDNGQGIEQEHHAKIFNMFFRGNTGSGGNGLGLYISRETCKKLGGELTFTSSPGEGSTFTLVLPNMGGPS